MISKSNEIRNGDNSIVACITFSYRITQAIRCDIANRKNIEIKHIFCNTYITKKEKTELNLTIEEAQK